MGGCRLDSKKSRRELFQRGFFTRNFLGLGGVRRYAATPLTVALSPGRSYITRFRTWSPNATANYLERAEIIPKVAQTTVVIRVQAFRDPFREDLPHVQIFMNDGPNPLT